MITAVVPFHKERRRNGMLATALWSIGMQTIPVDVITVEGRDGPAEDRMRGVEQCRTEWVAFLDSDDWWYPEHCERLLSHARFTGADYVYSYPTIYDMWEGARPDLAVPVPWNVEFDPDSPCQTTSTILVKREVVLRVGIRTMPDSGMIEGTDLRYGEDYDFTVRCANAGVKICHLPARTWAWRVGPHNTSGVPGLGDSTSAKG